MLVGERSLEIALTAGSGLGFHLHRNRRLITARLGTPTYKDFQYGLSALYGKVPEIRAEDLLYKLGVYTVLKAELAAGRDGASPVAATSSRAPTCCRSTGISRPSSS